MTRNEVRTKIGELKQECQRLTDEIQSARDYLPEARSEDREERKMRRRSGLQGHEASSGLGRVERTYSFINEYSAKRRELRAEINKLKEQLRAKRRDDRPRPRMTLVREERHEPEEPAEEVVVANESDVDETTDNYGNIPVGELRELEECPEISEQELKLRDCIARVSNDKNSTFGRVWLYDEKLGIGYIEIPDQPDVFVEKSSLGNTATLKEGDRVRFILAPSPEHLRKKGIRFVATDLLVFERLS